MANDAGRKPLRKAEVLRATRIPEPTFEHWKDSRLIKFNRDDIAGEGRGKPNLYGHRTVIKLAIAHKATKLGIPASVALSLAERFTDLPQAGRELGCVFPDGTTWILATADGAVSVINTKSSDDVALMLNAGNTVLNANKIISEINLDIGIIR